VYTICNVKAIEKSYKSLDMSEKIDRSLTIKITEDLELQIDNMKRAGHGV